MSLQKLLVLHCIKVICWSIDIFSQKMLFNSCYGLVLRFYSIRMYGKSVNAFHSPEYNADVLVCISMKLYNSTDDH